MQFKFFVGTVECCLHLQLMECAVTRLTSKGVGHVLWTLLSVVCTSNCMERAVTRSASKGVGHFAFGRDRVWSLNSLIPASAKTPVSYLL